MRKLEMAETASVGPAVAEFRKSARTAASILIISTLLVSCAFCPTLAGGHSSARSMAMAGAYASLASGVDAARFNPANLGLASHRRSGIEFVGIGVNIANNSFTLDDYNNYTGAALTEEDKADILGKIPGQGLNLVADVEASALSVSTKSLVFGLTGVGRADVNLSKDLLDLVLNGNSFGQEISITGSHSDAVAYVQASLSHGRLIYTSGTRQLSVGASVKYLRGLGMERIVELEGVANTLQSGFAGKGRMVARTATGGSGFGLDIGTALQLNTDYTVGLSIRNVLSSISWSKNTQEHGYLFEFDTMTVDNMGDDYIVSDDYTKDIPGFSSNLPSVMTVGIANTTGVLLWAIDWEQGFRRAAGASSKPRIALGAEWRRLAMLPLRAGFACGGLKGTNFSVGSGIHLRGMHIDFAAITGTSLTPGSSKGLNFAISTGLTF